MLEVSSQNAKKKKKKDEHGFLEPSEIKCNCDNGVVCSLFSLHQTYKKHGATLKKDHRHNMAKSANGHSNGATHTETVKHRKPRAD